MAHEKNKASKKRTRGRARGMSNKFGVEGPDKKMARRVKFLALIKSRYGYTNDKVIDELSRLLTQFRVSNRSLGIHLSQPNPEDNTQDMQ